MEPETREVFRPAVQETRSLNAPFSKSYMLNLHIYRYLAFLACELQGVTLLTGALNKHGPMGNKPIGQRKGIYRQHSGKQLFREKQKELVLARAPWDVIVDMGSPASPEQTRYQDGTAWRAASGW